MRFSLPGVITLLIASGAFAQTGLYGPLTVHPKTGDTAPEITYTQLLSAPVPGSWTPANLTGQITFLGFFPDTSHNEKPITLWNATVQEFAGKPVQFVWITGEDPRTLMPFLTRHPIKGWVFYDPDGETGRAYGLALPEAVVIAADGKILGFDLDTLPETSILRAALDGRITTTRPIPATLKDFQQRHLAFLSATAAPPLGAGEFVPKFAPSQTVHISPSAGEKNSSVTSDKVWVQDGNTLREILANLYNLDAHRILIPPALDTEKRYDIELALPAPEDADAMRARIKQAVQEYFHIEVKPETRQMDVYVLTRVPNGRKPSPMGDDENGTVMGGGSEIGFESQKAPNDTPAALNSQPLTALRSLSMQGTMDDLCIQLGAILDRPVANETSLEGKFEFEVKGGDFLAILRQQYGLTIAPDQRNLDVLLIQPAGATLPGQ